MTEPVDIRAEIERILAEGEAAARAAIAASVERARALLTDAVPAADDPQPRPIRVERDQAVLSLSRQARYAGRRGKPLADAMERDLRDYGTGAWRHEAALDQNPHPASTWRHDAWRTLKASPAYALSDRAAPISWRTILRVFERADDGPDAVS